MAAKSSKIVQSGRDHTLAAATMVQQRGDIRERLRYFCVYSCRNCNWSYCHISAVENIVKITHIPPQMWGLSHGTAQHGDGSLCCLDRKQTCPTYSKSVARWSALCFSGTAVPWRLTKSLVHLWEKYALTEFLFRSKEFCATRCGFFTPIKVSC